MIPLNAFTSDLQYAGDAIWKVLLASLVLGAGLPAIYALGIRSLAWGTGGDAETSHAAGNPAGKVVAAILFLVVAYGIVSGILFVIASGQGKALDFSTVIPTFTEKH
ncbi:MAG: hypothetical protein QM572_02780 [Nocardioides sp.]|uniref:hypothetical protein n=1 Tax=Nocardioides sp. TaxID=35761 RepID=UPI0039E413E0